MAKFAVLFFAALAFQATFAGVITRPFLDYQVGQTGGYEHGLQEYFGQIQAVASQWSLSLQSVHPTSKTLIWQSRELAQVVEEIIDRLQVETGKHSSEVDHVLQQVLSQLREIQVSLQQAAGYTDMSGVSQLKDQLTTHVQILAKIFEKLMYLVQANPIETQGSLYYTIKIAFSEFLTAFRHIQTQVPYASYAVAYEQSPMHSAFYGLNGDNFHQEGLYSPVAYKAGKYGLGYQYGIFGQSGFKYGQGKGISMQIQSVASDLSAALRFVYADNVLVKQTLISLVREYVQNLEIIVQRLEQVGYTSGVNTISSQQVAQDLKHIVLSLHQLVSSGVSMNAVELRNQLSLYVQQIASELEKLTYGVQPGMQLLETRGSTYTIVKGVLVQFLTATRNFQIQVQNISQVAQRGQTTSGFGIQIQTITNGLTSALESVSLDNTYARQLLAQQCHEFAQYLETIIERLQTVSYTSVYSADLPKQVAANLRQIVVALQQVSAVEDVASAYKLKMHLVAYIQEAATEIQKLLWVGQNYFQQGQGQFFNTALYGIFNDFVAALQRQQTQLYSMYHTSQYGQGTQHLAFQIQAITNNLAIFFQNVPTSGVQVRQQIEIQARRLAHNIESIIERLEIEAVYTSESGVVQQVVSHLKQMIASLEQVTVYETSTSAYELFSRFHVVLQKVASEMRKLAYFTQYNMQEVQGNLNGVVRSVLVQYLVVLQHVQCQFQGYNQTAQIGQTPRELALQIQIVAHRLTGMLRVVVPDNRQTQISLVYQARRLSQIIDVIFNKLHSEITTGENGSLYYVVRQVATNLKQIQMSLQQAITSVEVVSTYQLKMQLAARIQDAAIEIQKLMFVGQYDIQQGQGSVIALVRGALIDFLAGLQHLQMQIQDNLQIVLNGQNPRALVIQIQSVATRLSGFLQYAQSNSQQLRQTLIIQFGELAQTIENVIQMLQTEIKNNGEHNVVLKQVVAQLTKISLSLQQVTDVESTIPVNELSTQLVLNVQHVVSEIQKLAYIAQYKLQQFHVGTYHGALNGVFNNFLATFRNILIQFQNFQQFGQYGHTTQELGNQIQTVTNHLAQSFQLIGASSKQVKQALAIQSLKFARRIQYIVERIETEVSYNSEINVNALQQVVQNLKQVVSTLQQIGGSFSTSTITDLRTQINSQVQSAAAQFQKLLVAQTTFQQSQGYISTIVKSVLIEYLAAVQNLHIRVQHIAQFSQKGSNLYELAIQIETAAIELSTSFQHVLPTNKLVGQVLTVEARQLAQVIATIVNKLQSVTGIEINGIVPQVASQLKQIHLALQQIAGVETISNVYQKKIHIEMYVRRASALIQQLVWAVQPEIQQVQVNSGIVTIVRDVLYDFLAAIQNVHIQIQNVVQNGQIRQSVWGLDLLGQGKYQGQYYGGLGFAHQGEFQGQYYGGLERQGEYQGQYFGGLGLEHEGEYQGQYFGGLGLERQGEHQGQYYGGLERQGEYQGQYFGGLGLEHEGEYQGQYFGGLGLEHQGQYQGQSFGGLGLEREGEYQGQYFGGLGLEHQGQYQGQYYGGLYRPYAALQGLLSGRYYGGFGMFRGQSPKQYLVQIQAVVSRLSGALQSSSFNGQQAKQIITIQARQLAQIVENIIDQLQEEIVKGSDNVDSAFQQVIMRLREVQQSLKQIVGYNTFTTVYQLKSELEQYIQIAAAQMEKLVYIIEQVPQGNWNVIIRSVLYNFFAGVQRMQMQFQGVAQFDLYGQGYGYGQQFGKRYGYAGLNQYDNEYGYAGLNQYDNEYGYAGLNQHDNEYGYAGLHQYGNQYGYAGLDQHDNEYGYAGLNQYDNEYGYAGLNHYGKKYGYAGLNQYDNEYGYAGLNQYDNKYGYAGLNQYDNEYGYAGLNQYDTKYGYAGLNQHDNEYGYAGQFGQSGNGYGFQGGFYGMKYGFQGQSAKQLAIQLQSIANQVAQEIQTVATNSKQFRQVAIAQARQLIQVIDNIVDRLQAELGSGYGYTDVVEQVVRHLRQIQGELQQIVSSGVLSTIYQVRGQFANYIQTIAAELYKLAMVAQSEVQVQGSYHFVVKSVLSQYFVYLRNVQYLFQGNTLGQNYYSVAQPQYEGSFEGSNMLSADNYMTVPKTYQHSILAVY